MGYKNVNKHNIEFRTGKKVGLWDIQILMKNIEFRMGKKEGLWDIKCI